MRFRAREIFFVLAMIALFGCAYLMVFRQAAVQRASLRADMAAKQKSLSDLRRATAGADQLKLKVDALDAEMAAFETRLPMESELDLVVAKIASLANRSKVTVEATQSLATKSAEMYRERPVRFSLSGDFDNLYTFLQQLEQLPHVMRITQLKLAKSDQHDGDARAEMTLSLYFKSADPQTVATSDTETP